MSRISKEATRLVRSPLLSIARHGAYSVAMAVLLLAVGVGPVWGQGPVATHPVTKAAARKGARQATAHLWTQADEATEIPPSSKSVVRSRWIRPDPAVLAGLRQGHRVAFDLFDDLSMTGVVTRRRERSSDQFALSGVIDARANCTFSLAFNRDALAGVILMGDAGVYRIRYKPGGLHVLEQVEQSQHFVCETGDVRLRSLPDEPAGRGARDGDCDDGSVIDVLVVYTEAARIAAGGVSAVEAEIDLMVEYNDVSYTNSLIAPQWNLVFVWQLPPGVEPTLGELTDPDDGVADGVHNLRDAYGADQVALVNGVGGGVANGLWALEPQFEATAFCIAGMSTVPLVLSHEIGHNMGCCHAPGDGGGCDSTGAGGGLLFPYSNGHRFIGDSSAEWITVMAYPPGWALQHFSNPNVQYDGQPTGVSGDGPLSADNARTINLSAYTVSNWRCNDGICESLDLPSDGPDHNANGVPDDCDIALFINQLLGDDPNPAYVAMYDYHEDGVLNGLDIQPFVDGLVGP
ncbi:MAG: hypothetical protein ABII12_00810 [Planctomycetota bacterium]